MNNPYGGRVFKPSHLINKVVDDEIEFILVEIPCVGEDPVLTALEPHVDLNEGDFIVWPSHVVTRLVDTASVEAFRLLAVQIWQEIGCSRRPFVETYPLGNEFHRGQ